MQDGKYIINKDCDGFNCCLNNLALVTKSEKQKRVIERGRMDSHLKTADRSSWKNYGGYSRRKKIKQYKDRKLVAVFESIRQAARTTGFGEKEIIMVAKGRWSHYHGYKWKYAD